MLLTKVRSKEGSRWAVNGYFPPPSLNLSALLAMPRRKMLEVLENTSDDQTAAGIVLREVEGRAEAPIDPTQEVWAAGVTYLQSRDARRIESSVANMYDRVYEAERPEIFFKSLGWRVAGNGMPIHIRKDSRWNVPEPELVLVINSRREIVGYCAGNDVSSRDIEGENPLYLPQAKTYNGSCALGHGILICEPDEIQNLPIHLQVQRAGKIIFEGEANTSSMKRTLPELVEFLTRELDFPQGVFLMTGTCLVPDGGLTLQVDDVVHIQVGELTIENTVQS